MFQGWGSILFREEVLVHPLELHHPADANADIVFNIKSAKRCPSSRMRAGAEVAGEFDRLGGLTLGARTGAQKPFFSEEGSTAAGR